MSLYEQLNPRKVFQYFEEICNIPHGSSNTKRISDYCVAFAEEQGLVWYQDEMNNVIILKEGSKGYETSDPVIIQGHMDMVCEKESDTVIDFEKDGLDLYTEGDFLKARGTTLGGDDGIAIAYAFAILSDASLAHPPLEVVITVDEEIGMLGAEGIDVSMLKGKKLLNIDSDEEGIFLTSCAGGLTADCKLPVSYTQAEGTGYVVTVSGLVGGHSGTEIQKERANAIIVMGRVLKTLSEQFCFSIAALEGGQKDNAIPREAVCTLIVKEHQEAEFQEAVSEMEHKLKQEFRASDSGISLQATGRGAASGEVLTAASMTKILFMLRTVPCGVQHRSTEVEGLVETSLNAGILRLNKETLLLTFSVRSSVQSRKYEVTERLSFQTEFLGGTIAISGDYPAWEYRADSPMRRLMVDTYRSLFQKEPQIKALHAGLECGILSGKIENLDCISFGPENLDIHTPKERLSISSTERVWELIKEFLKNSK